MLLKEAEDKAKLEKELVCFTFLCYNHFIQRHLCHSSPLTLNFMHRFQTRQLLKQVAEYKLQLKSLKEQEGDMRTQVQQ